MNLNIKNVHTFTVKLSDLSHFSDIKDIFRRRGIHRYIYVIKYKGKIIKIGIQHKIQEPADRVYTQIGHMPGWMVPLLKRSDKSTGTATRQIIDIIDHTGFHKDHVEIDVYDFSHFNFKFSESEKAVYAEMQNIEEEMKSIFFGETGAYPVGNVKQEPRRSVAPDDKTWTSLFT
jgi:hypothetical protein